MDTELDAESAGIAGVSKVALFIEVAVVASGSRIAVVKNIPSYIGLDEAQEDAVMPRHQEFG
jgi:hypothetical protein